MGTCKEGGLPISVLVTLSSNCDAFVRQTTGGAQLANASMRAPVEFPPTQKGDGVLTLSSPSCWEVGTGRSLELLSQPQASETSSQKTRWTGPEK